MQLSETSETTRASGDPSISSSLEHLVSGSQGVITKRIDLALLEARELLSRTLQGAVLVGLGILLVAAAWLAATACLVLLAIPEASWVGRLAAFALVNGITALGLIMFALRHNEPSTAVRDNPPAPAAMTAERKN